MNITCKLQAKCLKLDENLEKCPDPDCNNLIHPSCGKKIAELFKEGEWEGPTPKPFWKNCKFSKIESTPPYR